MDRQEYHIGIKVKVFPIKATKAYRRRKLQFHSFFSSAPDGDEWPVSLRGRFRLIHRYHPNPATSQVVLQPATRIPPQPNHTETPTHIKTRPHDQCGDSIEKSQAPDDGCINVRNMLSIEEEKKIIITSDIKLVSYSSSLA